jgi:hypothetical protein
VKHAVRDGLDWRFETVVRDVGSPPIEARTSLAIDAGGDLQVCYYDARLQSLRYVRQAGGIWQEPETVDSGAGRGLGCSLAIDLGYLDGTHPVVSYHDAVEQDLRFCRRSADGGWGTPEIVDSAGDVGRDSSVKVDRTGWVHVSYHDATNADLHYALRTHEGWQSPQTLEAVGQAGYATSLAVSDALTVHISYMVGQRTSKEVHYIDKANGIWSSPELVQQVYDTPAAGWGTSLLLDRDGVPHVGFHSSDAPSFYRRDAFGWKELPYQGRQDRVGGARGQPGERLPRAVRDPSLALDSLGLPSVAYFSLEYQDLRRAEITSAGWTVERIEPEVYSDVVYPSLALAGQEPRISFTAAEAGSPGTGLYVASRSAEGWSVSERIWPSTQRSSIAIGPAGVLHLSFYVGLACAELCVQHDDLMYAAFDTALQQWRVEQVPAGDRVGWFNFLFFDPAGGPSIVYSDETREQLRIARRSTSRTDRRGLWQIRPEAIGVSFDSSFEPVPFSAVALPQGRVAVSYRKVPPGASLPALFVAVWDGAGWIEELVDAGDGSIGVTTSSLAYDARAERLAVFYKLSHPHARYAYRDGDGVWHRLDTFAIDGKSVLGLLRGTWYRPRVASVSSRLSLAVGTRFLSGPVDSADAVASLDMVVTDREHLAYASQSEGDPFRRLRYAVRGLRPPDAPPAAQAEDDTDRFDTVYRDVCTDACSPDRIATRSSRGFLTPVCYGLATAINELMKDIECRACLSQSSIESGIAGESSGRGGVPETLSPFSPFYGVAENLIPGFQALDEGRGDEVVFTAEMAAQLTEAYRIVQGVASPELASQIEQMLLERDELRIYVGMTFAQVARQFGIGAPVGVSTDLWLLIAVLGAIWWRGKRPDGARPGGGPRLRIR